MYKILEEHSRLLDAILLIYDNFLEMEMEYTKSNLRKCAQIIEDIVDLYNTKNKTNYDAKQILSNLYLISAEKKKSIKMKDN